MKTLLLVLAASAVAFAGDSSRYHEDFHYSYPQSAGGRFAIENFNGSVEITGWDQNTVDISGTKYADRQDRLADIKIEVSNSGNAVRVKTTHPEREHDNMGAKYVIRLPRRTELENIASSNGSLRVSDIEGNATVHTSNGSVHLANIRGNVEAHSSNGGVDASSVTGTMSFHTSNGSVRADKVDGAFRAETSNGAIDLHLDGPQRNDVVATTSNGGITVRMPSGSGSALHASTNSNGSVRSDFEILTRGELSKHRIEGTIGGGGAKMDLSTSNGNISLLKI